MKRASIFAVLLILTITLESFAQKFGIIAGAHMSKTTRKLSIIGSLSKPFELGYAAGITFDASIANKIPLATRLILVHKPDKTYEEPLNFVNFAVLLNPKLGKMLRLNFGPVIEYDTEKHGRANQLFLSGLAGLGFLVTDNFSINLDYQTNINNPGGGPDYKIRGQTIFLTAKYSFGKK